MSAELGKGVIRKIRNAEGGREVVSYGPILKHG